MTGGARPAGENHPEQREQEVGQTARVEEVVRVEVPAEHADRAWHEVSSLVDVVDEREPVVQTRDAREQPEQDEQPATWLKSSRGGSRPRVLGFSAGRRGPDPPRRASVG